MKFPRAERYRLLVVAYALGFASGAIAAPASDPPAKECLVALEDADQALLGETASCHDGDPACDADATPDGACTFRVRACVNLPGFAACKARKLTRFRARPRRLQLTLTPNGTASVCGAFVDVRVPLRKRPGAGRTSVVARVRGPSGNSAVDVDRTVFVCEPTECNDCCCGDCFCLPNPDGGPSELRLTVGAGGNDLDIGWTGLSHNFTNVAGATLHYCLSGCNGTTDPVCDARGSTGECTPNGTTFGPPLPLFSGGVPVCVVNRFEDTSIQAVVDVGTGGFDAGATPLRLVSDTYQGSSSDVCPRCVAGRCTSGRNAGGTCRVEGSVVVNKPPDIVNAVYAVSSDCLPLAANLLGSPEVVLPLTSGVARLAGGATGAAPCPGQVRHDGCGHGACTVDCAAKPDPKGGLNQTCCSTALGLPCFPTDATTGAGEIVRAGSVGTPVPAWPDPSYPKTNDGTLAAVFCVPGTTVGTVDATAGLPGPGALLLSGTMEWIRQ